MPSGAAEEFVIDVTAKFNDEATKGASAVDKELGQLEKTAASYGKAIDAARKKAKELQDAQQALSSRLNEANSRYAEAKSKADAYKNGIEALKSRLSDLNSQQRGVSEGIKSVQDRLKSATSGTKDSRNEAKRLTDTLKQLQQQHASLSSSISSTKEHITSASSAFKIHSESAKKSQKSLAGLINESKQLDQELEKNKRTLNENAEAYTKVSQQQLKLRQQNIESGKTTQPVTPTVTTADKIKSAKGLQGAGKSLNSAGNALSLGVTTPLVAAGTAMFTKANEYEQKMSRVKAISEASASDFKRLDAQAIKLGADTTFSSSEVAESMENLAAAGFSTNEIMKATPGLLDMAAASGASLADSSEIASSTLRSFNLDASQSGHVADVLAANANMTNAAVVDTGYAMKYAAPAAHTLGMSLEETAAAIGIMSNAGIKGDQAGTSLRGALIRFAKPTKQVKEAMEDLNVSFFDSHGKMKSLANIIGDLRTATAKLTQQQRTQYLAQIFGTYSLSGMLSLVSAGPEKLESLTKAYQNCNGVAKSTANIMMDNVSGSIEQMNGSLETAGITIQKTLSPYIREAADDVTKLANAFSELDKGTQKNILKGIGGAIIAGPALKGIGGTFSAIGKIKEFFAKHSTASSAVSGVAKVGSDAVSASKKTGLLSKAVSGVKMALGLVPLPLKLIAAGAAVAGVSMKAWHDYCVNDNLQKHFGDVQLSMQEVEDVAKRLTTTKWTAKVDTVVENDNKITDLQNDIKTNLETIEKTKWKASVGLKLTAEESSDFKSSVDSFISNAKSLVEQQHYTATLAIDAVFGDGTQKTNATKFADSYYNGLNSELTTLGTQLAKLVNDAFADGVLTDTELNQIDKVQQKIQKKNDEIEKSRTQVKLQLMESDSLRGGLTSDSFGKLLDGLDTETSKRKESVQKTVGDSLLPYQSEYDEGKISKEAYDKQVEAANRAADKQMGTQTQTVLDVGVDTIRKQYNKEYGSVEPQFDTSYNKAMQTTMANENWVTHINDPKVNAKNLKNLGVSMLDGDSAENVRKFTTKLKPMNDDMLGYADAWLKAGEAVPKSYVSGLEKSFKTEVMAGDMSHYLQFAGMQIGQNPSYLKMIEDAKKSGKNVPEEFIKGAELGSGKVFKNGIFTAGGTASALSTNDLGGLFKKMGIDAKSEFATNFQGTLQPEVQASVLSLINSITSNQSGADFKKMFSNANISISDGLATSISKTKSALQPKVSGLVASVFSGVKLDNSNVVTLANSLGTYLDQGVSQKISGLSPEIQRGLTEACASADPAKAMQQLQEKFGASNPVLKGLAIDTDTAGSVAIVDLNGNIAKMNGITGSTVLKSMKLGEIMNATAVAEKSVAEAQSYLNSHPLVETMTVQGHVVYDNPSAVGAAGPIYDPNGMGLTAWGKSHPNAKKSPGAKATGGIVGTKSLTWLAEEGYPEMVIPFNPARRQRALGLWQQTGEMLGVNPQYHAAGGIVGSQFPQQRDPQEIFASQPVAAAAAPVTAVASGSSMNLGGVQIIVQGGDGDIVKVIAAHKQEIAEAVAEVVNAAMDSANVPMAQGA